MGCLILELLTEDVVMKSKLLKILNPIIWIANVLRYLAHLDGQRCNTEYEHYDFDSDVKYF